VAKVVFTKRAQRDLNGLDGNTRTRILDAIREFSADPMRHGKKLAHARLGEYRYRIGEYRVVFDLNSGEIVILRVGHRRDIYRH